MSAGTNTPSTLVHPVICHADGRRTQRGELSFFTTELNRLGAWKSQNYFDVPAESYHAGWVTGYRCAAELLEALEQGQKINMTWVIRDVIEAGQDPAGTPGRRGASVAFMEIMGEAIGFTAQHGRNAPWMARKIEHAEGRRVYWATREAEERAEFSARMKAARQAKRAMQSNEVAA